ncbi:acyl-CoA thioesterase II [Epidermidibacterium keratini]|uniref:Acyl-CoA thioesterase II n=1 Tax=Epidermidibacterium keratini TaxID=1891644 RepID=A0A7L4YTC2_9ACTN|nr:acyl-CoA thioesterase domain-containing protein [Epidermidibacterium keratini]QHC02174.1 acyl-CoA thioesterase II [Epidermidibacterium keratini]
MSLDHLADLFALETIDTGLYRSTYLFTEERPLYGGQVAAQALVAAARTAPEGRTPHSMHCYFLRGGDPAKQVVFHVANDFDGGSFSSRRVIAVQEGKVIFNCTVSFHAENEGPENQMVDPVEIGRPEDLDVFESGRLHSVEMREAPNEGPMRTWPQNFWARTTAELGTDPVLNAAALVYLTDGGSGLVKVRTPEVGFLSTIDHTVWIHRIPDMSQWHLFNYLPRRTGGGRGLFTGSVFDGDGYLVASFSQECLFRYQRKKSS